ncbi:unnamed protein product [Moneuplotes crassus]|uniref:Uncharacterized protein n=1 Tax=Euplotes crassus TaxID=5936 RepID=A0AAD1Y1P1_EUPCR|nr:unnamed protein product [Moneuplotes crassus]
MSAKHNGLWVGSLIFAVLGLGFGVLLSIYVYFRTKDKTENGKYQKENAVLTFFMTLFGAFCMWGMWICVYMHQMNPLILPFVETQIPE